MKDATRQWKGSFFIRTLRGAGAVSPVFRLSPEARSVFFVFRLRQGPSFPVSAVSLSVGGIVRCEASALRIVSWGACEF